MSTPDSRPPAKVPDLELVRPTKEILASEPTSVAESRVQMPTPGTTCSIRPCEAPAVRTVLHRSGLRPVCAEHVHFLVGPPLLARGG
jgi:hypothetical protein